MSQIQNSHDSADGLAELYTQVLLDAAHQPVYKNKLDKSDKTATVRNASCGDTLSVELELSKDGQTITKVGWQGDGCIISQAHMDGLAMALIDQKIEVIKNWGQAEILNLFGLPNISPGRLKCLMLGLTAVQQALAN